MEWTAESNGSSIDRVQEAPHAGHLPHPDHLVPAPARAQRLLLRLGLQLRLPVRRFLLLRGRLR
ncbi:hypothetical protein IHE55_12445 [Streptomyces pactum]|uniref:Uncharacterized protein n=1 Tax=Streptomyces pactum TaxID=68249 RepID=A0ABS0NK80_9ACTN|nr:hypothetical protein [Streptomyces pactum]MBH5335566.1 hypothetical protein [Streptomyces pactum]